MPRTVNVTMTDTGGGDGYIKPKKQNSNLYNVYTQNKSSQPSEKKEPEAPIQEPQAPSVSYYAPEEYYAPETTPEPSKYGELSYDPVSSQAYTDAMTRLSQFTGGLPSYTDQYADQITAAMGARPVYDDKWSSQIDAAMANKPADYVDPFEGQLNALYDQIVGRGKFNYDVNGDALYQQYKDLYTQQGQMAMQDTMGQAAALTGGYGSTYSQNAGQQAYNSYLQQLGAIVPDLEARAFSEWQAEGQDLQNQYAMLQDRSNQAYGRYQDQLSDYYNNLALLEGRSSEDYGRYRDQVGDWQTDTGLLIDQSDRDYGRYRDQVSDYYAQYDMAREDVSDAYKRQNDERSRILDLIGIGYTPSEAELSAAGMSTGEAQAYIDYYNSLQVPVYSGGGGGGGGGGGSGSKPDGQTQTVSNYTKSGLGTGTDEEIAKAAKDLNKSKTKSASYEGIVTTAQIMQSAGTPAQDIANMIFTEYSNNRLNDKEAEFLINRYA